MNVECATCGRDPQLDGHARQCQTIRAATALRAHWNATRAKHPKSGDSKLGQLIGDLLAAIEREHAPEGT